MTLRNLALCLALLPACGSAADESPSPSSAGVAGAGGAAAGAAGTGGDAGTAGVAGGAGSGGSSAGGSGGSAAGTGGAGGAGKSGAAGSAGAGGGGNAGAAGAGGAGNGGSAGAAGGSAGAAGSAGSAGSGATAGAAGAPACVTPPEPQVFETGTGQQCFERLTPGQVVPMIQGPQGGFHLWLAIGCADCAASTLVEIGVKDMATGTFYPGYPGPQKQVIQPSPGPWGQRAGLTAPLPGTAWDPESQLAKGTHVLLSASVLDLQTSAVIHGADVEVVLGDIQQWNPCSSDPSCGQPGGPPCCTKGGTDGTPPPSLRDGPLSGIAAAFAQYVSTSTRRT